MKPADYWDRIAHKYDAHYQSPYSAGEDASLQTSLKALIAPRDQRRILDIGCGTGLVLTLLEGCIEPEHYTGLDFSQAMLDVCRERHPKAQLVLGSAQNITELFTASSFDVVVAANAAASFVLPSSALFKGVRHALTDRGEFCLSFLNRHSLRRMRHFRFGETENYKTRGDKSDGAGTPTITHSVSSLRHECHAADLALSRCDFQSVFGGVWETHNALRIEPLLSRVLPSLGHYIIARGTTVDRSRSVTMEAIL